MIPHDGKTDNHHTSKAAPTSPSGSAVPARVRDLERRMADAESWDDFVRAHRERTVVLGFNPTGPRGARAASRAAHVPTTPTRSSTAGRGICGQAGGYAAVCTRSRHAPYWTQNRFRTVNRPGSGGKSSPARPKRTDDRSERGDMGGVPT